MENTMLTLTDAQGMAKEDLRLQHFGPALVTAVLGGDVELKIAGAPGGPRFFARLALPILYQPQVGDIVLAMAAGGACYVIGVIEGRGTTMITAPGDLELRAPDGAIRIAAAQGCDITGPAVCVRANTLDLIGDTLHEDFTTVRRHIAETLEVTAKAMRTLVTETYRLTANRIMGRGETSVVIDAPSINLG